MDTNGRQQYGAPTSYSGWSQAPQPQPSYQQAPQQGYYGQPSHAMQQHHAYPPQSPVQHHHLQHPYPPPTADPHHHQHHQQAPPPHIVQSPTPALPHMELGPSENYETSVYVGLEDAPSEFRLAFRVIGEKGLNLEYLSRTTKAKVILRGRGTGIMNAKPMHIYVGHDRLEGKEEAESLANNLVRAVKEEYADWLKTTGYKADKPKPNQHRDKDERSRETANGKSQEMQDLRITREHPGQVEITQQGGHLGKVEVHEDSRRVVKLPSADQSVLSRLGPRVGENRHPDPANNQPQPPSFHGGNQLAHGKPGAPGRRRTRSRSPLGRGADRIREVANRSVKVRKDPPPLGDLRAKLSGDRDVLTLEKSREMKAREERMRRETLTITTKQNSRDARSHHQVIARSERPELERHPDRRGDRQRERPVVRDERRDANSGDEELRKPEEKDPFRRNSRDPFRGEDHRGGRDGQRDGRDGQRDGRDVQRDGRDGQRDGRDGQRDGRDVQRDGRDVQRDGRDVQRGGRDGQREGRDVQREGRDVQREGRDGYRDGREDRSRDDRRRPNERENDYRDRGRTSSTEPSRAKADFGMAAIAATHLANKKPVSKELVKVANNSKGSNPKGNIKGNPITVKGGPPKFFIPGLRGHDLDVALQNQDFSMMPPIFIVRKGFGPVKNYVWVVGDTAAYLAAQRAAEHPDGPNLGIKDTMILWFGYPGLKFSDVVLKMKGKLDRNMTPSTVILHVGGEDLRNYVDREQELTHDMRNMLINIKDLLPTTHVSWSNILPWQRYPSNVSAYTMENLRLRVNDTAKHLMRQFKGSTLYHDHDFIQRKDNVSVYHYGGFYPSLEGARFMVQNFNSIIKDLQTEPGSE